MERKSEAGENRWESNPEGNWQRGRSHADDSSRHEQRLHPPQRAAKILYEGLKGSAIVIHASVD
jgi:hypothetical protein